METKHLIQLQNTRDSWVACPELCRRVRHAFFMKVFFDINKASSFFSKGSAVAIGNYDGVHFGHRAILKKMIAAAKKQSLKTCLVTFEPHPAKILAPHTALKLISTHEQKIELLKETGLDAVLFIKFSRNFAKTAPESFYKNYLLNKLAAKIIYVGHDFTFGDKRCGNIETLEVLSLKNNVKTNILKPQMLDKMLASSSLIRKLIKEGNIKLANKLLTRLYFIDGNVVHGHHRGTSLGVHTANLDTINELIPLDGVYATRTQIGKKTFASITNIGFNPTFDNKDRTIETHILDFDKNIYDKTMRLFFVDRIRDEIRFANSTVLVKQIEKDIKKAQEVLNK